MHAEESACASPVKDTLAASAGQNGKPAEIEKQQAQTARFYTEVWLDSMHVRWQYSGKAPSEYICSKAMLVSGWNSRSTQPCGTVLMRSRSWVVKAPHSG